MERRYWLIASGIVATILAFLLWDPGSPVSPTPDRAATATIIELGDDVADATIATVELAAADRGSEGDGAGSGMIARFELERPVQSWAARAESRLNTLLEADLAAVGGKVTRMECRATACRVNIEFENAESRTPGVATILASLQGAGVPALIERAERKLAVFLIAP